MDCSPPGSSVHGIILARILEWVDISSSRGSSQSRDGTRVSCTGRWILYHWATWKAPCLQWEKIKSKDGEKEKIMLSTSNKWIQLSLRQITLPPPLPVTLAKKAPNDVAHASWSQASCRLQWRVNYVWITLPLQTYIQKCRERDGRVLGKEWECFVSIQNLPVSSICLPSISPVRSLLLLIGIFWASAAWLFHQALQSPRQSLGSWQLYKFVPLVLYILLIFTDEYYYSAFCKWWNWSLERLKHLL